VSKEPLVHTRGARLYAAGAIMHAAGEFGGVVFDYRPTREGIVVFAFGNGPARHPEWSSHRHLLYAAGSVAAVRGAVHQYQPVHAADGPPTELVSASHLLGVGSGGGVPGIVVVLRGNELEYACDEGYALFIIDGTTPTTRLAVGVSTGPLAVPLHGRGLAVLARAEVAAALEGWLSKEALNSAFARGAEANFALAALDDLRARVPAHDGAVVCLAFQTHEGALQPRILRLSCSADQSSVLVVTDAVVRFARELGVDHPDLVVMREALDEALANSVEHGSGMDSSQLIHVSVRSPANDDAAEGSIAVTIGDSRTQIASPGFPTHPKRIRGMGGAGEGRIAELTAGLGGSYHRQASTSTLTFFSSLSIEESSEDE
jgi:anti-sigma regulatory factor (Ser/Thr protein kinase)